MTALSPRTDWREDVLPDEAERFERLAKTLHDAQTRAVGDKPRVLHAKGVAGVRGEFTVLHDLPAAARVGVFATQGTVKAYVRFSNGSPNRQPDRTPDVRGLAVKLLGVSGAKLIPGMETATTQDFLAIRSAFAPFRSAEEFVWVACAAQNKLTFVPKALAHLGFGRAVGLLKDLSSSLSKPFPSAATSTFHSALPIKWGDHAVRFSFAAEQATDGANKPGPGKEHVRDDLRARLLAGPLHYQFRVQFFVGDDRTPIERSGSEWKEADSPFVPLARLTIPQQDIDSEQGKKIGDYVDSLSFDPWHAPVEFRPLGSLMRARNVAYRVSTMARGAAPEPAGASWPI